MALNGQITTNKYSARYYKLVWNATQSIENNESTINYTLSAEGSGWWAERTLKVVLAGTTIIDKTNRVERYDGVIKSGAITVTHDIKGTKNITASIQAAVYGSSVNLTASNSWDLDTIPRAATVTSATDFNDETQPTLNFTNYGGYKLRPYLKFWSDVGEVIHRVYRDTNTYTSPYTWEFTEAERKAMRQAIQKDSCIVSVGVETYDNSGTYLDTNSQKKKFSIINAMPTLEPDVRQTDGTIGLTGSTLKMIKYYNKISVQANYKLYKEASLVGLKIINGNTTLYDDGEFTNCTDNKFIFKLQDSRGNHIEKTITLDMIDYIPLTCNVDGNIELDTEDGTKANITITISGNYFNGSFGVSDNNLGLRYSAKCNGEELIGEYLTLPAEAFNNGKYEYQYTIPYKFNYKDSFIVSANATDKINYLGVAGVSKTLKAIPVFDWGENDFNFNVPVTINNVLVDYPVESGTKNGWEYRKWKSGRAECWKVLQHTTAINTQWGALYTGTATSRQEYPLNFDERPIEQVTLGAGAYQGIIFPEKDGKGENSNNSSGCYNICRPSSVSSSTFYIHFYVCGKWG